MEGIRKAAIAGYKRGLKDPWASPRPKKKSSKKRRGND